MVLSNLLKTSELQNKFGITKTLPYLCRAIQQSKSLTHGKARILLLLREWRVELRVRHVYRGGSADS